MRTTVTLPRTLDVSPTRHGTFRLTATATTRAKRDAKWKELAEKKDEARCHCGERFPKHLAEFMNNKPSVTHACKCGVVYVVKRGKFVAKQQNGAVAHGA
jgi:ketosteroid isomerase-like protein